MFYLTDIKLCWSEAISYAKIHSNRAAAKRFNIDERRIREFKQKPEKFVITRTEKSKVSEERLTGGGRKFIDQNL